MPVGTQMMPLQAPDDPEVHIQTATGLGGPPWFWSCFDMIFFAMPPFLPFRWVNIPLYTESVEFVFDFTEAKSGDCLGSQKKLWTF